VASRLSIVIPSHQRADLLARCLASLRRHAPAGTEVLVVNDGSPDGVIERTARTFAEVEVLRLPQRRGFCAAANAGIARVRGDVIEVLNDDTEVLAGWAEAALARFADQDVGAVTPLVLLGAPGGEGLLRVDSAGDVYLPGGVARKRGHGEVLGARHLTAGPVFGASGSGSFYRRSAITEVGGFPEEFIAYFDDVDLSFRLGRAGWTVFYEPASRIHHYVSASYGAPRAELLELQSRNEELVYWRNSSLVDLPLHLAVLAGKAVRRWREGQLWPFLRGRWEALGMLVKGTNRQRVTSRPAARAAARTRGLAVKTSMPGTVQKSPSSVST
jgi:GT2 family glycosyltransferase